MLPWQMGSISAASRCASANVAPPSLLIATPRCLGAALRPFGAAFRMLSMTRPSESSTTWLSLNSRGEGEPPSCHVLPPSSAKMTCALPAVSPPPLTTWLQGITSRPLCGPCLSWMPTPGPVAYHVQSGRFTSLVILRGGDHVTPSSSLVVTQTVRVPLLVPRLICPSASSPRLCVLSRTTVPVRSSATAHGLPHVFFPSAQTTVCSPNVFPPSVDRRITRLISPESACCPHGVRRPSAKTSSVPFVVTTAEGMR